MRYTILSVAIFMLLLLGGFTYTMFMNDTSSGSVELGISEMSPRGVIGGYAMPASGGSHVHPPPTVSLLPYNSSVPYNTSTTLGWSTTNSTSCTASGNWSGSKSASGGTESTGNIILHKTYVLQCQGEGGSASDSAVVRVISYPKLTADKHTVRSSDNVELTWDLSEVVATASCVVRGGSLVPPETVGPATTTPSGTITTAVAAETTFILDCGPDGFAEVDIRVLPRIFET